MSSILTKSLDLVKMNLELQAFNMHMKDQHKITTNINKVSFKKTSIFPFEARAQSANISCLSRIFNGHQQIAKMLTGPEKMYRLTSILYLNMSKISKLYLKEFLKHV